MPDVWITGLGMITPAGLDAASTWQALAAGKRFVRPAEALAASGCRTTFAGQVCGFRTPADADHLDRSIQFALAAAAEAMGQAGLPTGPSGAAPGHRRAVVVGSSKGCILRFARLHDRWFRRAEPLEGSLADIAPDAPATTLARAYWPEAPALGVIGACATGTQAIIRAAQWIDDGRAELVLCGACDASIHPLCVAAFERMGVLAQCPPGADPQASCRPFDAGRTGFAIGEGAAMLILESPQHARSRGARPLARLVGWALAADPTGITKLDPTGRSLAQAIRASLHRAGLSADQIDYVNAHGTGTPSNDLAETQALRNALGKQADRVAVSSIKGAIGHLLGAAGAVETAVTVMAIADGLVPPTVNHERPGPGCDLDYVPGLARRSEIRVAVKTSVGFGGQIGVIVIHRE